MELSSPVVDVAKGYKFAVIAIPGSAAGRCPRSLLDFGNGLAASAGLPAAALDTWNENIGTLHVRELAETNLFLWSLRKSASPEVLDDENEQLARDVYCLYLGLLIAAPDFSGGRVTALTGGNSDGTARVRSVTTYARSWRAPGAVPGSLTASRMQTAARLAIALRKHSSRPGHRIVRAMRAFREAREAPELDLRLHQFVRCIEGFVVPPFRDSAVHFADRVALVTVGRRRRALKELYRIRSGIEHLHGPYDRMAKRPAGGKLLRLVQRCIQAEAVARYMLHTYLLQPALWSTFRRRSSVDAFWQQPAKYLRKHWPSRIAFDSILASFDFADFERHAR